MNTTDTIAALATPPGAGGIAVVRLSGPITLTIAQSLLSSLPEPRQATVRKFLDAQGAVIDHGVVLFFPAPHSFTGEDVLELHAHGAPVVVDMLLKRIVGLGARLARPGEFSERAFLNDKLDLVQAEAIADLISAGSEAAARSALRSLSGEFSRRVHAIVQELVQLRTYVEAAIDFPEEEIDFLADENLSAQLNAICVQLDRLIVDAQQGSLLQAGMTIVLAGAPNAGKSSLLNALAREDTAIVSPIPGTTRDIVRAHVDIDGMPIHVLDTAGLRSSTDAVEQEGMERARTAMTQADHVLLVVDDSSTTNDPDSLLQQLPSGVPCTVVYNKVDLSGRTSEMTEHGKKMAIALSARTGIGMDLLRSHLKACMGFRPAGEGGFIARRRHVEALVRAHASVVQGHEQLAKSRAGELLADDLRCAQEALGEITGEFTSDDLLGRIFSSFCIGK